MRACDAVLKRQSQYGTPIPLQVSLLLVELSAFGPCWANHVLVICQSVTNIYRARMQHRCSPIGTAALPRPPPNDHHLCIRTASAQSCTANTIPRTQFCKSPSRLQPYSSPILFTLSKYCSRETLRSGHARWCTRSGVIGRDKCVCIIPHSARIGSGSCQPGNHSTAVRWRRVSPPVIFP